MTISRRALIIAPGVAIASLELAPHSRNPPALAAPAGQDTRLAVTQEDARTFTIARPDAPALRVTFLTATALRVRVQAGDDAARLPDYMRVKADQSYPPEPIKHEV